MRVLYLLNFAGKAGTERYVETLARTLKEQGRITPFFAYHVDGLLVRRMEEMGVPTRQIVMQSRFDQKAAQAVAELCREWEIDVIHTHYLRENYIAMLSKKWNPAVKVVYTSHFVQADNWYTRISNRVLSPRQDGVIAVCNIGKTQLVKNGLDPEKIRVVFNGVDPQQWSQTEQSATLKAELGLEPEVFCMLCASRFADDKGHAYLVDSIARLKQKTDRPFHLALAGDGPLQEQIKQKVQDMGLGSEITFLGFREDMKHLFHGSDLYVNSSRHEALSFLIVEAMASGLPVIATDMGGNSDIVNEETGCGLLVEYNNPDSMADAMKTMLEDPAVLERCREGAKRAAQTVFHVERMVDRTYDLYDQVCGRAAEESCPDKGGECS
ncbi:MAG: glycosyltransferase family 4 protein [Oscillospiraceae bacterium]|nr:glycosyltransferase family 4 protein [Oscillospiraceae bacterium]